MRWIIRHCDCTKYCNYANHILQSLHTHVDWNFRKTLASHVTNLILQTRKLRQFAYSCAYHGDRLIAQCTYFLHCAIANRQMGTLCLVIMGTLLLQRFKTRNSKSFSEIELDLCPCLSVLIIFIMALHCVEVKSRYTVLLACYGII